MQVTPARVASLMAAASALLAGLAPAIADLDTTSTAGLLGGAFAVVGVLATFLKGQRAHEARVHTWSASQAATATVYEPGGEPELTDDDLAGRLASSPPIESHVHLSGP